MEHNNLAQKNLTIIDLAPNDSIVIPVQLGSRFQLAQELFRLEVRRPQAWTNLPVSLLHPDPEVVRSLYRSIEEMRVAPGMPALQPTPVLRFLEAGRVEIVHRGLEVEPVRLNLGRDSTLDLRPGMAETQVVGG